MRLHVHISDELAAELSARAKAERRPLSKIVREVLQRGLEQTPEQQEDLASDQKAEDHAVPGSEVGTPTTEGPPNVTFTEWSHTPAPAPQPPTPTVHRRDDGELLLSAKGTCRALGIPYESLLDDLDEADLYTVEGETCITDLGVRVAIAVAKSWDIPTSRFEHWYAEIQQATHQQEFSS